ncbi:MAG: MMPL family transporter [Nitrosomonas sp.]|nr:MMPL family transporter [Nitrosomonas sp.]MCP5251475.1 MMPL family transporter [Burkholderiales bacterium]MCP5292353.1 MMPL family transporter [Burkholderiales bacterium]
MSPFPRQNLLKYVFILFYAYLLLASFGLVKWELNNSMEIWFYENDPQLVIHKKTLEEMGEWDWLAVVLETRTQIYDSHFLDELKTLSNRIADLDHVRKIISIANARGTYSDSDELEYRVLYSNNLSNSGSHSAEFRQKLLNNPVFINSLFREDQDKRTVILIQDENAFNEGGPARVQLVNEIRGIINEARLVENFWIVGTTALNVALNTFSLKDVYTFYPLVFGICIFFGWWVFGNWRDLLVSLSIISAVVATIVSSMVYSGHALNMVTIMLPAILTSLSMANVVHIITHFHQLRVNKPQNSLMQIAAQVSKKLWIPCLGSAVTTSIGFISLTFAGIVPVSQLGIFGALGIFLGFLLTIFVAPLLLAYLWRDNADPVTAKSYSLKTFAHNVLAKTTTTIAINSKLIIILFGLLAISSISGFHALKADTSYLSMFKEHTEIRNAYAKAEESGFSTSNFRIYLDLQNGLEDPDTFLALDKLQKAIDLLPEVIKTVGPIDAFKEIDRAMAKDASWKSDDYQGYNRETFAQILFVGELSNNDDLRDLLLHDNKTAQLFIFTNYLTNNELIKLVSIIENLISTHLPDGVLAEVTGVPVLWATMDQHLIGSQINSILLVTLGIGITLLLITRSIPLSMIGLAVSLLPILSIIGLMSWLGIKLNMGTILIGGIALGLAIDDTIHFMWHYINERCEGIGVHKSLEATIRVTGLAIFITSIVIAAGFSIMMLSQFVPTVNFGLFTTGAVLLAMFADILLLPAILMAFHNKLKQPSPPLLPSSKPGLTKVEIEDKSISRN